MSTSTWMPAYLLSHGGGPWPWLTGPMRDGMAQLEESLRTLPGELPEAPKAILMTAHWEARAFTVQTHPKPPMIYDFGGFLELVHVGVVPARVLCIAGRRLCGENATRKSHCGRNGDGQGASVPSLHAAWS